MAKGNIVIHTIYGKQYAYLHWREGSKVRTKYLYPVGSDKEKRDTEYKPGSGSRFKQHIKKPEPEKPHRKALYSKNYKEYGGATVILNQYLGKFETALYVGEGVGQFTINKVARVFSKLPEYVQKHVRDIELFKTKGYDFEVGGGNFEAAGHWHAFTQTIRSFDSDWNMSGSGSQKVIWHEGAHALWNRIEVLLDKERTAVFEDFRTGNSDEWNAFKQAEAAAHTEYDKLKDAWDAERAKLREKWAALSTEALEIEEQAYKTKTMTPEVRAKSAKLMAENNEIDLFIDKKNAEFDKVWSQTVGKVTIDPYLEAFEKKAKRPVYEAYWRWQKATASEGGLTDYSKAYVKAEHSSAGNENFAEAFSLWMPFELGIEFEKEDIYQGLQFLGETLKREQAETYAAFKALIADVVPLTKSIEEYDAEDNKKGRGETTSISSAEPKVSIPHINIEGLDVDGLLKSSETMTGIDEIKAVAEKLARGVSLGRITSFEVYKDANGANGAYTGGHVMVEPKLELNSSFTWIPAPAGKDPITDGHYLQSVRKVPQMVETAIHEGLHGRFSANTVKGHELIKKLKDLNYGGDEFEGLMTLGTFYVIAPDELKKESIDLYNVAKEWLDLGV